MKLSSIFILFLLISCSGPAALHKDKLHQNDIVLKQVPLEELLLHKGRYHNQYIETKGYYLSAFEISGLFDTITFPSGDTMITHVDYTRGLWVEFGKKHPEFDSVQKRIIKIRGLFDTTNTGHMGNYEATISGASAIR